MTLTARRVDALASFTDYDGLRKALLVAHNKRDVPLDRLEEIAGLPDRYLTKILGPRGVRRIGMQSLGDLFGALGIKGVLVEDPEAWAKVQRHSKYQQSDKPHLRAVQGGAVHITVNRGFLRKIGAKGGANSRIYMSKSKSRRLARKAAAVRWGKIVIQPKSDEMNRRAKRKAKEQNRRARQRRASHKARKANV